MFRTTSKLSYTTGLILAGFIFSGCGARVYVVDPSPFAGKECVLRADQGAKIEIDGEKVSITPL